MYATVLRPDGVRVEALVLAVGWYSMRLIPRDGDDTLELRNSYGRWTDESGAAFEIESLIATDGNSVASTFALLRPEAMAAN